MAKVVKARVKEEVANVEDSKVAIIVAKEVTVVAEVITVVAEAVVMSELAVTREVGIPIELGVEDLIEAAGETTRGAEVVIPEGEEELATTTQLNNLSIRSTGKPRHSRLLGRAKTEMC